MSLLPPNATTLERHAAQTLATAQDLPVPINDMWNPDTCPAAALPWLAWALHVDGWEYAVTEAQQREAIRMSVALHRKKGTPWAIKRALSAAGYPAIEIIEQHQYQAAWAAAGGHILDGTWVLDASVHLTVPDAGHDGQVIHRIALNHWAQYALRINVGEQPWTAEDQISIRRVAQAYAPARSHLVSVVASLRRGFASPILMLRAAQRLTLRLLACRRFQPLERRTLDGCWTLGGSVSECRLDGSWTLNGTAALSGPQLIPTWSWARGHITASVRVRIRSTFTAGQRIAIAPALNPGFRRLDGRWRLDRNTLQGWQLDEGITLADAQFDRLAAARLDGTWLLGDQQLPSCISMRAAARLRAKGQEVQVCQ